MAKSASAPASAPKVSPTEPHDVTEPVSAPAPTSLPPLGEIEYDGAKFSLDTLHPASIKALASRGLARYLGNEASTGVTSKIEAELAKHHGKENWAKLTKPQRKEEFEFYREQYPEQVKLWEKEAREEAIKAIAEGAIGTGTGRGPKRDSLQAECEDIAERQIRAMLNKQGVKPPKDKKEVIVFPSGTTRTWPIMISNWLSKNGETIRKLAEESLARKSELAAEAASKAETKVQSPEEMGL